MATKKAEQVAQWRRDNPEKYREQQKRHLDKMKKEKPEELKLRYRRCNYKCKYGITVEQFDEMLASQGGVCAICKQDNGGKHLAVDHCHKSGKVRKLLCTSCNLTVEHLENAKTDIGEYLKYIMSHEE